MANTPAYYDTATITAIKSFIVQAPGVFVSFILFGKVVFVFSIIAEIVRGEVN